MEKILTLADHLLNIMIILFFLPLLLFGIYAIWDNEQINQQADTTVYHTYRPSGEQNSESFEQLKEINSDVIGWIQVEGTEIDYPVVQGQDNSRYVNTDVKGEFSLSGSIFLDCSNKSNFSDMNNILYGHQMEKHKMFGDISNFLDESFFQSHTEGAVYYENQWHEIELFSMICVDAYDPMVYNTTLSCPYDQQDYLSCIRSNAVHFRELDFKDNEHYIAMSTCSSENTNERYVLVGRIQDGQP